MNLSILIVDDELNAREGLRKALQDDNRRVEIAADGKEAFEKLSKQSFDLMISDIRMPNMGGMELLEKAKAENPEMDIVMLTAYGTIDMAVQAIKKGAYDYLAKPINLDELDTLIDRIVEKQRIQTENQYHREQSKVAFPLSGIVGNSPAIRTMLDQIQQIAPTNATVLITGETGTGKELVARAIHENSPRKNRLYVPIHCAALAENLLESELFGHERGAFTGAVRQRKGRFEMASHGTLFLDEISEISPSIQVKLLRVLQEKQIERVGGSETIKIDIRIIAATNRNLKKMVDDDKFREDLFYRLRVVTIDVPALRERKDDIPLLVQHFARMYAKENNRKPPAIDEAVIKTFQEYDWPGNVRELQGIMESMVILCRDDRISIENVPQEIRGETTVPTNSGPLIAGEATLADLERQAILETLDKFDGNRTRTAEALGIGRRTLIRKLHEYGVSKSSDESE